MPDPQSHEPNRDPSVVSSGGGASQDDVFSGVTVPRGPRRFDPTLERECRLSRSKIELFIDCPRCFYVDMRFGKSRTGFPAFTLNNEVDRLLKKEFDLYRELGKPHPYMEAAGIDAVPFKHEKMKRWQDALHGGIQYKVPETNLLVTGGVDDIWESRGANPGQLIVVDYKATASAKPISLDDRWKEPYKRQVNIYQWLFKMNGFDVSDTAVFLFCNAHSNREEFNARLDFSISIIQLKKDYGWVEQSIRDAFSVLCSDEVPAASGCCESCNYIKDVVTLTGASAPRQ